MEEDLEGFSLGVTESNGNVVQQKSKNKKGGFQAMGLSFPVFNGIIKRGYKIPTPIQRKTIPIILEGRDVVAMAKTGSGKTACFLIPLFEKLKIHRPEAGVRALILSPTRELAIQTFKFIKDLSRFMDFKTVLILGGDSMDYQFNALHSQPDIIVATPGRFLHVCVEMDMKLKSIEYVVFDEADRLFEMGFGEQLSEILQRLPSARQMLLFSATLPKQLVQFAKADLNDPVLIRLDVESKLPDTLALKYVACRPDERLATLVGLLKYTIPKGGQVVVFAATQHHVEMLSTVLNKVGISNTYIYSTLDPSARKINTAKFQQKQVMVLIVTDVAARGIDIPHLDYVINYHFPGKPKLFVHRVGRCARAGRSGTAYSIFATEDQAHLLDLFLFLDRKLSLEDNAVIGKIPQDIIETEHHSLLELLKDTELAAIYKKSNNGYKQYIRSRPTASTNSNKAVKELPFGSVTYLEDFEKMAKPTLIKENLLEGMKKYRPVTTIFELNPQQKSSQNEIMRQKRKVHEAKIEKFKKFKTTEKVEKKVKIPTTFENKDDKFYIPYNPSDKHTEDGLAINPFTKDLQNAELSLIPDNEKGQNISKKLKKWDRVKKKMVSVKDPREGKILTEAGVWIPATYKTGKYDEWKERTKIEEKAQREGDDEEDVDSRPNTNYYPTKQWARHNLNVKKKKMFHKDKDLKTPDQLVKKRIRLEQLQHKQVENQKKNMQKRKMGQRKKQDRMQRKRGGPSFFNKKR